MLNEKRLVKEHIKQVVSYSGAAAVMYVIGSLLANFIDIPGIWIAVLGLFLVFVPFSFCVVAHFAEKRELWIICIIPALFFGGFAITERALNVERRSLYPYAGNEAELRGTVVSVPVSYGETKQFMLQVAEVVYEDEVHAVDEKIKVSTNKAAPQPGSSISIEGKLKIIGGPKNSTGFDSRSYYIRRGVFFSVFAKSVKSLDQSYSLSAANRVSLFTSVSMNLFLERFPASEVPLLKGIILNNKSEITDEVTENMLKAGTYRYIYCPYLHISIIIFILGKIFGNHKYKYAVAICIFMLYLFMNISIPSAWKICMYIGISYGIMNVLKMRDMKTALYLTVLITGICSPLTLTEPGFVISVVSTILVRAFSRSLTRVLYLLLHNRKLAQLLSIYLIILIGVYPICSYFGYNMTPWSFLLGFIFMPLTTLIYVLFYISFGIYMMSADVMFLGIPYLTKAVTYISEVASKLPFASLNTPSCSLLFVIVFYSILYCIYRRMTYRKSIWREILTMLLCFVLVGYGIYGLYDAELTFLSVGNADCAVIELPGGETVMVDGGGSAEYSDYDTGETEVLPYLKSKGINKIDAIILSHYDKDHAQGVVTVMKNMTVKEIFVPYYLPNGDYRDIIETEAKDRNIKLNYVKEPENYPLAKGLDCEFIYCGTGKEENDNSLVAKIKYGEVSMLFPGDITKFAEYKLKDTEADILKVPHHGSKTSSSESFIEKTNPLFSVISVGADNPYGHPADEVVSRYESSGTKLLRTDVCGDIHFIIGKERIKRVYAFKEWFIYGGFKKG